MCVNNLSRVALDSGEVRIRTRDLFAIHNRDIQHLVHTILCDCRLICTAQQLSCDQVKRLTELWPRTCHTYMKSNSHVGLAASAQYSINTSYLTGLN